MVGRKQALEAAKRLSRSHREPVRVQRADERVDMTFRHGNLDTYQFETHARRRRNS